MALGLRRHNETRSVLIELGKAPEADSTAIATAPLREAPKPVAEAPRAIDLEQEIAALRAELADLRQKLEELRRQQRRE